MEEDEVKMTENGIVHIKWIYTPADFFEGKVTDLLPDYEHAIENGEIIVEMDPEEYKNHPEVVDKLHNQIIDIFRGAALVTQKTFKLNRAGEEIIYPSGRKDFYLHIASSIHAMAVGSVDIVATDPNGNIVVDTKKERLDKRKGLALLSEKYGRTDATSETILLSFEKSLNQPKTELVHLYEIRDALSETFNGEKNARDKVGISKAAWSRLGVLTNDLPLKQGRHSGKHIGVLREATPEELKEARDIAVEMVIAYWEYLERNNTKTP